MRVSGEALMVTAATTATLLESNDPPDKLLLKRGSSE
jgi:hypothetical protein